LTNVLFLLNDAVFICRCEEIQFLCEVIVIGNWIRPNLTMFDAHAVGV